MKQLLNEMMKINEEEVGIIPDEQAGPEKVQITPELIASLVEELPELADVDQSELEAGLESEQEHLESVGGEMITVAKIVLDHIKEFPGKQYYQALAAMEHELKETPEEETEEHKPGGEEAAGEVPAGETPAEEAPIEKKKVAAVVTGLKAAKGPKEQK
jgi:hypothetical protein